MRRVYVCVKLNARHGQAEPGERCCQYVSEAGSGCANEHGFTCEHPFRVSTLENIDVGEGGQGPSTTGQRHPAEVFTDIDVARQARGRLALHRVYLRQSQSWPKLTGQTVVQVEAAGNAVAVQFNVGMAECPGGLSQHRCG